jgi:hypothetical protein
MLHIQSDMDALKSEMLGSIINECGLTANDLLCILFSANDTHALDDSIERKLSILPLEVLKEASQRVMDERPLQEEIIRERKELLKDGVFIPMLRFEQTITGGSNKISGGRIQRPLVQQSFSVDDSSMSYATDNSSRVDV